MKFRTQPKFPLFSELLRVMPVVPEAILFITVPFSTEKVQKRKPQQQVPEPLKDSRKRDLDDAASIQVTAQDPESVMTPFPPFFLLTYLQRCFKVLITPVLASVF